MSQPIIFYDIPSQVPGIAWSPNTWKVRYALNIKRIQYKTHWVEYPDIAGLCKKIGAAPTSIDEPRYTFPVIHDPNTKTSISESGHIVRYLDKTFPDTPVLIPAGTSTLHAAFQDAFLSTIQLKMLPLMLPPTNNILNTPSEAYFRRTRESRFGKLEEWAPPGPKRENFWKEFEDGLSKLEEWITLDGADHPYFMGDQITYADLTVGGWLVWVKKVLGSEHEEWAKLQSLNGGRWGRLLRALEKYESIH